MLLFVAKEGGVFKCNCLAPICRKNRAIFIISYGKRCSAIYFDMDEGRNILPFLEHYFSFLRLWSTCFAKEDGVLKCNSLNPSFTKSRTIFIILLEKDSGNSFLDG